MNAVCVVNDGMMVGLLVLQMVIIFLLGILLLKRRSS